MTQEHRVHGEVCAQQDIAYSFTEQDILEIKQAVAAVEERGLKVHIHQ